MKVKQLSLFLENKPGALSGPMQVLAKAKINILTLSVADSQNFGILRLIVRDWEKAKKLLEKAGFVAKVTDMVTIEVPDRPGGLSDILLVLEKAGVNVEYMYAFTLKREGRGMLLFRLDNPEAAAEALQKKKINVVDCAEVFKRLES